MAQIDRLVLPLTTSAGALHLEEGKSATIEQRGDAREITRGPVTGHQAIAILREVAPADAADKLLRGEPVDYVFESGGVPFHVTASRASGVLSAVIAPASESPSARVRVTSAGRANITDLLMMTLEAGASDLHLRASEPPTLRRDGSIERVGGLALTAADIREMIAATIPPHLREGFDRTGDGDYSCEIASHARFRVNVFADRDGPAAVFRHIPIGIPSAADIGLSTEVQHLTQLRRGLVLVTGPTGSGKSTTLAAMLDMVNTTRADHIVTIEDPIEFVHRGKRCLVSQRQVGEHTSSFRTALRAALREDPDVVMIGEMRDLETVEIALETAETGHLVFATLHTSTAAGTIDRIIDQFPAAQQSQIRVMLSNSLRGVIAQTLCRRIGGGRVAAREVLLNTAPVANLIRESKTFQIPSIIQTSRRLGMTTLNDALIELVDAGVIAAAEAWTQSMEKPAFAAMLKARGIELATVARD